MTTTTKKVLYILLAVVLLGIAGYAIYGHCKHNGIPADAAQEEQVMAVLTRNDCFVCHSATPALPFYASFPVIGPMLDSHVHHAQRFTDLQAATADLAAISEPELAKLEYSVLTGSMPIHQYRMIHWGTGLNGKEKAVLLQWIADVRAARFSNGLSAVEHANEPLQPLPACLATDVEQVALGERMYNDPRISLDGTISCASCHILEQGGADEAHERTSEGIYGQFGGVNAPTVYNAFYNVQQFWNGRAADLQEQAAGPPVNPVEMGDQTWDDIVARLRQDKALVKEFERLYPGEGLTQNTVTLAIAEYEKTLLTPDCPFDLWLRGNADALTADEKKGYEAFKELGCATCHAGVIVGGQSFEYLPIYGNYFADRDTAIAYCADDDGLKGFTGNDADLHKFKVPTLRNIALTPPYFHDGSQVTLEDAVRAMGRYELNKELSDTDVALLVGFMNTLTGKHEKLQ
ncbi:MAG: cytochrome c peroxidase [Paludibacteraceae bacterium]